MNLKTLLDLVSLPVLAVGLIGVAVIAAVIHYIAEWITALLCMSGWWRGYVLVTAGFMSGLIVMLIITMF